MLDLFARQAPDATDSGTNTHGVYLSAVLLATASFIVMLLILPPMVWHYRNRNIGATVLVAWTAILLLFNFINAILWPHDDIENWYSGSGLCDVEVKIQVASQVALPAALACIMRALAAVLDTDRATVMQTKAQRRRNYIIDLACCFGAPILHMIFHYIVQPRRYYLYGITGCLVPVSSSWVTILLLGVPNWIWDIVDSYYAILILVRLYRYRLTFRSILASNDTTKSRFMRLYVICILWILGYIPVQVYALYVNLNQLSSVPYSWSNVHDPEQWNQIPMYPSHGNVIYDRWIWLSAGLLVFVFFGFGKDAVNMYRTGLLSLGLGRLFPRLRQDYRGSIAGTISSYSSKAKMMFKRKTSSSEATWTSDSRTLNSTTTSEPESPLTKGRLEAVGQSEKEREGDAGITNVDSTARGHIDTSLMSRIASLFRPRPANCHCKNNAMPLTSFSGETATVESAVTSGPRSPSLASHAAGLGSEMLVRTEVRQGSEHQLP